MSIFTLYSRTTLLYRLSGRSENIASEFKESSREEEAVQQLRQEARNKLGITTKGSGWGVTVEGSYSTDKLRKFEEMKSRKLSQYQSSKIAYFENRAQQCGFSKFPADRGMVKLTKHKDNNWLSIVIDGELIAENLLVGDFTFGVVANGTLRLDEHCRQSLSDKYREKGLIHKRNDLQRNLKEDRWAAQKYERFAELFDSPTTPLSEAQKDGRNHTMWSKKYGTAPDRYVAEVCLEVEQDIHGL